MDPLGFALENFDAIGRWRTRDEAQHADRRVGLAAGRRRRSKACQGLRSLLAAHGGDQFVGTVTEQLLAYALGRGVEYYDRPALRRIVREAARGGYRWSALILGIVKSTPFQMRRAES